MKRKLEYGTLLMWTAAAVAAPRYAGAFLAADTMALPGWVSAGLNGANVLAGVAMGLLEVISTAYLLDALRDMKPQLKNGKRNPHYIGTAAFAGTLLVLAPIILAPYVVSRMTGEGMAEAIPGVVVRYVWAVSVVIAPIVIVAGVAFARDGMVKKFDPAPAEKPTRPAAEKPTVISAAQKPHRNGNGKHIVPRWDRLSPEVVEEIAGMTTAEIVTKFPGVDPRTARNWKRRAAEKLSVP